MEWTWAFISTVVADVAAASAFYADALGLAEVGAVEFDSIGAAGELFDLGMNVGLAVVAPVRAGAARQLLELHRGGLCHLGVMADQLPDAGRATQSSFGEGRIVPLAESLEIEFVQAGSSPASPGSTAAGNGIFPSTDHPPAASVVVELDHVATVVPDLEVAVERLGRLGILEDPEVSRWNFPQLLTRNAVFPARSGYLEINQAFSGEGLFGSLAAARGAGIVGLTLTVRDMNATLRRLRDAGIGVSEPGSVLARTGDGEERDLGQSAVVSMKHSFSTRLFLFAPSAAAPHYRTNPATAAP
jgi:catechol 2,3-dioxygenase-like lactoylglutathione lyase family enzyme